MTVENISWSISTKRCCQPWRGSNPPPPGLQSDGASKWATKAGRNITHCKHFISNWIFPDLSGKWFSHGNIFLSSQWGLLLKERNCSLWEQFLFFKSSPHFTHFKGFKYQRSKIYLPLKTGWKTSVSQCCLLWKLVTKSTDVCLVTKSTDVCISLGIINLLNFLILLRFQNAYSIKIWNNLVQITDLHTEINWSF